VWTPSERKAPAGSLFEGLAVRLQDVTPAIACVLGGVVGLFAMAFGVV
jgi:hypothetical protein